MGYWIGKEMKLDRIRNAAVILSGIDLRTATDSELQQVTRVVAEEGIVIIKNQEKFNQFLSKILHVNLSHQKKNHCSQFF